MCTIFHLIESYVNNREFSVFKALSTIVALIFASSAQPHESELFFVNVDEIRVIAIQAAYEKYPDIPTDGLVEEVRYSGLSVNCESALKVKLVKSTEEEFQHCSVQLHYDIRSTIFEDRYIDDAGTCMITKGSESIDVLVYSDGSTIVGRPSLGTSKGSVECTEDFENLSE